MNVSDTKTILEAISEALNSGQNDVTVFVISLSTVIILIIMFSLIVSSGNKRKVRKSANASYQKLIRKFNLTILEIDLLEELAQALRNPTKKYLLLVNKGTFRYSVQKMEGLYKEKKEILESLRRKLGFSSISVLEEVFSTKLFKPGTPVKIETDSKMILDAEIYSVSDSGIVIKNLDSNYRIKEGETVRLIVCAFDGFKIYNITALKVKEVLLSSKHAEPVRTGKKVIKFNVIIKNERDDHIETRNTKIVAIADNGAGLLNTPNKLIPGDDIRIYLDNDKKHISHVNAEVIKTSGISRLVTVRYTHLREHTKK